MVKQEWLQINRRQTIRGCGLGLLASVSPPGLLTRVTATAAVSATCAGSAVAQRAAGHWRTGAALPLAVQEIYPAVHQGEIYVAGGIASRLGVPYFTDRCLVYNVTADTWRDTHRLPEPLHHAALVSDGKRLLLVGGFNGAYTHIWRMRDRVLELTPDGWRSVSQLPSPQAEGVVSCSPAGLIHLVTGQRPKSRANSKRKHHREVSDHWVWAGGDSPWRSLAPIPTPRNSATGGWVDGQLIIAGGRTSAGNLNVTEIYDPATDQWRTAAPMPLPQAGTASVVQSGSLVVFGGEIFSPTAAVFKDVWRYELAQDSWQRLPPLPTPRHGLGAARIGADAYVLGGATRPSGSGTSKQLEILSLG